MCGIVGRFNFTGSSRKVSRPLLESMRDTMVHRGPDGAGAWVSEDEHVGLGFRRLAIIDLSTEALQPMSNEDGSIRIVFNGEIYNHAEVRRELETIGGHDWKTDHSDSEVIVHAFEQWGIDCLQRFRGMFAIAIWDGRANQLWLVRDRVGVKPLYYSLYAGGVSFASEIKALLEDPELHREVDEEALFHYLSFLTTPAPNTLFKGVKKLAGGTWLRIDANGDVEERRWWDPWDHTSPLVGVSDEEISGRLIDLLRESVKLRKVSDVPVGVFLSGGIDSSTNAKLFSEGEDQPVSTFSIGYDQDYGSYKNELDYAQQVAEFVGADHHELRLTVDDLIGFLPKMIHLQDEPIADPVCVPLYFVSKLARDNGMIVCQVGEGADELFWGYPTWKRLLKLAKANQLPLPALVKRAGMAGMDLMGKGDSIRREYLRRATLGQPIFWGGAEAFGHAEKMRLLSPRLRDKFKSFSSWEAIRPIHERFKAKAWETSNLHWMSTIDLNLRLPELLLMRVDKMSMGVSLEGRVPFLDHKFVEFALSIPEEVKTRDGELKYILKKAVRGLIPDEIIDRRKQGFNVPVHEWFFERLGDTARQEISDFCAQTDFLDRQEVMKFLDEGRGPQAWYLLNLALWWKHHFAGDRSASKLAS
jgi:asparagine synthase (glutamine-hydrolysing)